MRPLPLLAAFVSLLLATETAVAQQGAGQATPPSSTAANQAAQRPLFQGGLGGMLGGQCFEAVGARGDEHQVVPAGGELARELLADP